MRVYELAKQLGIESKVLIPELNRLDIAASSHSNTLSDEDVQKALTAFGSTQVSSVIPSSGKSERATKRVKKSSSRTGKSRQESVEEEAPAKPERKHILIKRKRDEDETPEPETPEEEERDTLAPVGETDSSIETPLPPELAAVTEALDSPHPTPEDSLQDVQIPAASPDQESSVASKKHEASTEEKLSEDEKPKKSKKSGKVRDEALFAAKYEDAARWQDLRPLPTLRREERSRHVPSSTTAEITKPRKKTIKLHSGITVKEYAEQLGQRSGDIIKKLMEMGVVLNLNQPMDLDAGVLIAEGFGIHVEVSVEKEGEALLEEVLESTGDVELVPRAPVVTIMGHVDHGKTSLLDAIRQSNVTDQESGGITQHIGAYSVSVGEKKVTFLDTPGHEAFTAMRARGAQATDIVVLVVAADDGVMPQTLEAAHHAQAANVPIIVAVNKIDKPGANPDRVKQGLSDQGLIPEAWGGQTIFVEVSAKEKQGLDTLLEMILLQAEVMELKADIAQFPKGVVLEAKLDRGRGPVATVLVQSGILKVGAPYVVGTTSGRVRAMLSHDGKKLKEARPSTPVEVIGLLALPAAGDQFVVVKDERMAREVAEDRKHKQRTAELGTGTTRMTLDDLYSKGADLGKKDLSVLVKADAQGSLGALCESIQKIQSDLVNLQVLHSGVGGITESDVLLASASKAMIVGFHVRPEPKASALAEREGVEIRLHTIIYNAIADVRAAAEGMLEPTLVERVLGRAEVREVFTIPKIGTIAGCYVNDGHMARASEGVRVLRDHVVVYDGKLGSLRRFKDDVREVQQGYECGIAVENFNDIKVGDIIEAYVFDKEAAKL
ncbi:translation initiation factor IF-2 [Candidatus Nitronereus thalassa]|uniref:Translation initiation factor IF-2 n=1 Tax=Candidatus Nitronereus thalassa TaxID=3020898 RepID=A0ABU3K7B4_9BACT|nr:translation initiation factor IF-2 [Candidatus Nitronereus thalassa]MDT7042312.1 translation initiation factor IF-2 [Candidatus Nitronereus thalassa]